MPEVIATDDRRFDALPEGDYELTIVKGETANASATAKNPGALMWKFTYQIEGTNRKVFDRLIYGVKSCQAHIDNWWRALGNEITKDQQYDTGENPEDYIGRTLGAHLVVTEYNGDPQNQVHYFLIPQKGQSSSIVSAGKKPEPDDIPF